MYKPTPCHCTISTSWPISIQITNTEKQTDSTKSSHTFVTYTIMTKVEKEANRRYSEFESFRKSLVKLYPTCLVPPIPEKHSFSDYTTHKQKDDTTIIEKRKRMLERFLKRIADHPILHQEHIFHRFLDGNHTWSDILHSAPLLNLPKDPLLPSENSFTLTKQPSQQSQSHSIVPVPSSSYTLKYPDKEFEASEFQVSKSAQQVSLQFEKSQKRILHRLGDLSNDYSELGSAYNALSLNETEQLASCIEKIGQVVDDTCTASKDMVHALQVEFSEHVQDYTQYVLIAKQVLRYRRLKQAQLELIEEAIDAKKNCLRGLVKTEEEAQKLKTTMDQLSVEENHIQRPIQSNRSGSSADDDNNIDTESIEDGFSAIIKSPPRTEQEETEEDKKEVLDYPTSASAPVLRASKNQTKRWSSPRKLFSAVTYTIQGMIDTDPEQTRRNQIDKLKATVEQLEHARVRTRQELKEMACTIHEDFERLQKQKETELKSILISFAKIHAYYCEQNAASWEDIRKEVVVTMDNIK
ncbi:Autophagy-protein 20 [Rhizopus stolonifer]|uniref:Autophagy-protein 20 n=1 Tax=Rhizopus stolonifer TaxID=4846 RepID=A0A367KMD6_RHIST|nr:Autophagy-protein 20 [Rhizopus stolonifer]